MNTRGPGARHARPGLAISMWRRDSNRIPEFRSDSVTRPLLSQAASRIRAEDSNGEVNHTADQRDAESEEEQPGNQAKNAREDSEEEFEHEQARNREEPDHENGAEHSWVLPNEDC